MICHGASSVCGIRSSTVSLSDVMHEYMNESLLVAIRMKIFPLTSLPMNFHSKQLILPAFNVPTYLSYCLIGQL